MSDIQTGTLSLRELSTLTGIQERLLKDDIKPTAPRADGVLKMSVDAAGLHHLVASGQNGSGLGLTLKKEGEAFRLLGARVTGISGVTELDSAADSLHVARAMGSMKRHKQGVHEALGEALRAGGIREDVGSWTYLKMIEHYHAHAQEPMVLAGLPGRQQTPREILDRELNGFKREVLRDKAGVATGATYTLTTEGRSPEKLVVHTAQDQIQKISFVSERGTRVDLPPTKETQAIILDAAKDARSARSSISEQVVSRVHNQFKHHKIAAGAQTVFDVTDRLTARHQAFLAQAASVPSGVVGGVVKEAEASGAATAFKAASQRGQAKVFVLAATAGVALAALVGGKVWGETPAAAAPDKAPATAVSIAQLTEAAQTAVTAPVASAKRRQPLQP